MSTTLTRIKNVLTRTSGYLRTVTSHSVQPYQGCSFGNSLCGVGCYVQHNGHLTRGRPWGSFLEVRENAAESYREHYERECRWARIARGKFSIFLSSSTDPFVPQEARYGVTQRLLAAMCAHPPDELVLQTHSHRVADYLELIASLAERTELRLHLSIETDREAIPGLPPHASSVGDRLATARRAKDGGIRTVVTVSPLLPLEDPDAFFARIAEAADAVVLDHFIEGDGTPDGRRTRQTGLVGAIEGLDPKAAELAYRDQMARVAQRYLPGRVAIGIDGFAGRFPDSL
ncbi:MAG: hypothetical protein JNG90_13170 [Planctomycetaceae bacterium]|nr:hypothetical protein [Planctomycetaceae bacterium]